MRKISSKKTVVTTVVEKYEIDPSSPIRVSRSIINGKEGKFFIYGEGPHKSRITVVKPEFWDYIRTKNPFQERDARVCWDEYGEGFSTLDEVEQAWKAGNIIYNYSAGHMIFALNGDPIPLALHLDYIRTILSNQYLDLDKALALLKEHPWVVNKNDLEIKDIPYYNAENDRNRTITVNLLPDAATYKRLYQKAVKLKGNSFSTLMKDWFGCQIYRNFDPIGLYGCLNERGKKELKETRQRAKADA